VNFLRKKIATLQQDITTLKSEKENSGGMGSGPMNAGFANSTINAYEEVPS
jgi:hypothetical protein